MVREACRRCWRKPVCTPNARKRPGSCSTPRTRLRVGAESSEILQIFNSAFDSFAATPELDLFPAATRGEQEELNELIYRKVNNGVYKCGFARTQAAYDVAIKAVTHCWLSRTPALAEPPALAKPPPPHPARLRPAAKRPPGPRTRRDRSHARPHPPTRVGRPLPQGLFAALEQLEARLASRRYLMGDAFCWLDLRLFHTLVRFDPVYHTYFKCNVKRIADYPALLDYMRDIYARPAVKKTVNMARGSWVASWVVGRAAPSCREAVDEPVHRLPRPLSQLLRRTAMGVATLTTSSYANVLTHAHTRVRARASRRVPCRRTSRPTTSPRTRT